MPRQLDPEILSFESRLVRGAFVIWQAAVNPAAKPPPDASPVAPRVVRFQYNPETITRTRSGEWEARKVDQKQAKTRTSSGRELGSLEGGGLYAKSETIAMKLVFDATEALLAGRAGAEKGVLPELATLELASLGGEPKDDGKKKSAKNNDAHPREMLLVLNERYFPVIITSMTITEKRFNPDLVPVRAEVDLQMKLLEAVEVAGNPVIMAAFEDLLTSRFNRSNEAYEAASATGGAQDFNGLKSALAAALERRPPPVEE